MLSQAEPSWEVLNEGDSESIFRVASLNVAGEDNSDRILNDLRSVNEFANADLLLLQEAEYSRFGTPRSIQAVADALQMKVFYGAEKPNRDRTAMALAILSRYDLSARKKRKLKTFDRVLLQRERIALAVTVHAPMANIRIVNLHMDTRINAGQRREQLEGALRLLRGFNGPRIIGGDFNTADVYWIKQVFPEPLGERPGEIVKMELEREGFATPFDGKSPTVRFWGYQLDWIFISGLLPRVSSIQKISFSDHRAVCVECMIPRAPLQTGIAR